MDKLDAKKRVLECLIEKRGIVSEACRAAGIGRSTFYLWASEDEDFKKATEEAQEEAIDYVEGKLFERITGVKVYKGVDAEGNEIIYDTPPSDTAIIFYLKTKGKKRGYIEKSEVGFTDPDGKPVAPVQIYIPSNGRDNTPAERQPE